MAEGATGLPPGMYDRWAGGVRLCVREGMYGSWEGGGARLAAARALASHT